MGACTVSVYQALSPPLKKGRGDEARGDLYFITDHKVVFLGYQRSTIKSLDSRV